MASPSKAEQVLRLPHGEGRQALLEAVVHVVAREGFEGLTYRAVAAEAGVTHGLVHYHFGSRDAMISETLRWAIGEAIESSLGLLAEGGELDSFADGLPSLIARNPDAQTFQNELLLAACRRPELRAHMDLLFETYFDSVRDALIALRIDATPALTRLVFAALNGLVLQQLYFRSPKRTGEALAELRALLEPHARKPRRRR
jgi:TetR/AcrR family transcriptional regulator, regulator of biofilm formation and stress response